MTLWLDAQLPPQLAFWIEKTLAIDAIALRDPGLREAIALLDGGEVIVELG